ncbi:MAG: hypothetical protein JWR26_2920 [Pedosphaera sp.]|nr:hypothetical protein [Pedosphaera sp.]
MSIISGTVAGVMSADAQRHATNTNADNTKATNQQNLDMFNQSRGSGGSAVMPTYMTGANGQPFESGTLAPDLMKTYTDLANNPNQTLDSYNKIVGNYQPMQQGATNAANSIFNGGWQQQAQQNFAPVAAGRVAYTRQGAVDALHKQLGQIEATQANRGFVGDSSGNQMLKFGAQNQAGQATAAATIQNLTDQRSIADQAQALQLQNIGLPLQMAQQGVQMNDLAANATSQAENTRLQPLSFLKIGTASPFQYQQMPIVPAIASAGQLAAQAMGQVGGDALKYYLGQQDKQQNQDFIRSLYPGGANSPYGASASSPYGSGGATAGSLNGYSGLQGAGSGTGYGNPYSNPDAITSNALANGFGQ